MKANSSPPAQPKKKKATVKAASRDYILKLYVAGQSPKSINAIANIRKICEENLHGCYELEVIDLYLQPERAQGDQIIALPTLIRKLPLPLRRIIGSLSDAEQVLVGLDIQKAG